MTRLARLWGRAALLLVLLVVSCAPAQAQPATPEVPPRASEPPVAGRVGYRAPEFTLATGDGSSFTLSQHRGQVVLLNFWASWCGPCRVEMPHLQQVYREKSSEGVDFLFVGVQETRETALLFAQELRLDVPLGLDIDGAVTTEYLVTGLPTTVLIDREGIIRRKMVGYFTSVQEILDFLKTAG